MKWKGREENRFVPTPTRIKFGIQNMSSFYFNLLNVVREQNYRLLQSVINEEQLWGRKGLHLNKTGKKQWSVAETLHNDLQLIAGLPYKFEMEQMLEEPQWELIFEKTRWIIEKYRFCHRYVSTSVTSTQVGIFLCLLLCSSQDLWLLSPALLFVFLPTAVSPWIKFFIEILT